MLQYKGMYREETEEKYEADIMECKRAARLCR